MRLIYHPHAETELIEAARYYENRVTTLGVQFLDEADRAVETILQGRNVGESSRKTYVASSCTAFRIRFTIAFFQTACIFLLLNITADTLITGDTAFLSETLTLYRASPIHA